MQDFTSRRLTARLMLLAVALLITVGGCSTGKKQAAADKSKSLSGTDEQIFIGDTIEKNYDPNVIMKRAEAFFEKEDYAEAVIEYQHFLDLHHIHVLAPYAQFRLGDSHFRMAKSIDRDPEPIHKAKAAFEKLLKEWPGSRYQSDAIEKIHACQELLAQASMFVGHFYFRRASYLAAAYRFESVYENYPDMPQVAPEALYYLAMAYKEMGADDWVQEKLTLLAERYPSSPFNTSGHRILAALRAKHPETMVALANGGQNGDAPASAPGPAPLEPQTVGLAGQPSFPSLPSLTPVTGQAAASLGPQATLCRLGSWC
ncbi:MAG: outer membrane protein assembly factor BamD [Nitrospirota bacterium]